MKRFLGLAFMMLVLSFPAFSQMTGSIEGVVLDGDGNPLVDVRVALHSGDHGGGGHGGGHGGGMMGDYETWTDDQGEYLLEEVVAAEYEARAMLMGFGMDEQDIEILANQTITANFTLDDSNGGGGHMGGHWMHEWEEVDLHGWTIIEPNDFHDFYFLDEENDGEADFMLGFGPPGYEPPSGAQLPEEGDEIDVTGGLMTMGHWMTDLPMVMVFELNGETWFEPDSMGHHNGHGGGWHENHGCTYEEPELTTAEGWAIVSDQGGMHDMYWLDEDDDQSAEYRLDFGTDDYTPGNGASRPVDGDWLEIVGGLIEGCPTTPTIVVYEINGMFWREPGDTTGLGPALNKVGEDQNVGIPESHLIVETYPNPFNPSTTVNITMPRESRLQVSVFDIAGREISSVDRGTLSAGTHQVTVDAHDWAAGIYFIRVKAGGLQQVNKIYLIK